MGTLAAGRWKTPGRKTVESCPVLDVRHRTQRTGVLSEFSREYLRSTAEQHPVSGDLFQL